MKKILIGMVILVVSIFALGIAGFAYANNPTPPAPEHPYGPGMMGDYGGEGYNRGMMGGNGENFSYGMMGWNGEYGTMHDAMVVALAEALGLTQEEVEARQDTGETLWQIAAAEGLTDEEIRDVMLSAHDLALEDVVTKGLLTEEQAEWMDAHMEQMWSGDYENGGFSGHCGGGRYSNNSRWQGDN
jgi:hypothetical protein